MLLKHGSSPLVKFTKLPNTPPPKRKCLVNGFGSQVKARYTQASSPPLTLLICLSFQALLPQSTPLYTLYRIAPSFSPFQCSWNKAKAGEPHGILRFHSSSDLLPQTPVDNIPSSTLSSLHASPELQPAQHTGTSQLPWKEKLRDQHGQNKLSKPQIRGQTVPIVVTIHVPRLTTGPHRMAETNQRASWAAWDNFFITKHEFYCNN